MALEHPFNVRSYRFVMRISKRGCLYAVGRFASFRRNAADNLTQPPASPSLSFDNALSNYQTFAEEHSQC